MSGRTWACGMSLVKKSTLDCSGPVLASDSSTKRDSSRSRGLGVVAIHESTSWA
jgi:hypothetical protein